jgi:polyisoprenoid-binding protein YceI
MKFQKSLLLIVGLAVALFILFYSCKNKSKSITNETSSVSPALDGSGEIYLVDTTASIIEWIGSTPGNYQHNGIIGFSQGKFTVKDNRLTSGKFTIDINSINNLDQQGKDKANLENHLKEKDFFEVEKYPSGNFEITGIQTDSVGQKIIGNLTLKGVTNSIEFAAQVKIDEKSIFAETSIFTIDRTKWGIVYNSGIIGTLKDDLINDAISLKLKIVAAKLVQ